MIHIDWDISQTVPSLRIEEITGTRIVNCPQTETGSVLSEWVPRRPDRQLECGGWFFRLLCDCGYWDTCIATARSGNGDMR